ncbi:hypothetical protein TIFTF001_031581 [Ficus carica]|uniref:Uncharacterized protein n=1 Tax=Ficus carica TaxID=3494 RepID=A0AA88J163_FICCA|nr:hypothetical protein TIFTF001_031581 [Ficus carica]
MDPSLKSDDALYICLRSDNGNILGLQPEAEDICRKFLRVLRNSLPHDYHPCGALFLGFRVFSLGGDSEVIAIDEVGLARGLWCKRIPAVSTLLGEAFAAITKLAVELACVEI